MPFSQSIDNLSFLGISKDRVAIIMDLAFELFGITHFTFYPNIDLDISPRLAIKKYDFEVMPLGSYPESSKHVFLGTPGPKNKKAIFDDFYTKYGISKEQYIKIIHPT